MICKECSAAGTANASGSYGSATVLHQRCKGGCSCQHKVGQNWALHEGEKPTLMQTQSP